MHMLFPGPPFKILCPGPVQKQCTDFASIEPGSERAGYREERLATEHAKMCRSLYAMNVSSGPSAMPGQTEPGMMPVHSVP